MDGNETVRVNTDIKMEVSGRKKLSASVINASCEEEFLCDPCLKDGQKLPANGFCIDCQHYLCDVCFKYHLRPLPMRHHALLDKSNMPKAKIPCDDVCKKHKKPIEYFCESHSQVACRVCKTTTHSQCKPVKCIKELTEEHDFSCEIRALIRTIDNYKFQFNEKKRWAGQIVSLTGKICDKEMKNLRELRKKFDEFEERVTKEVKLYKDEEEQSMNDISSICDRNLQELQTKREELNILQQLQSKDKLFIHAKNVNENMIDIKESFKKVQNKKAAIKKFDLEKEKLHNILNNDRILQQYEVTPMNLQLTPREGYSFIGLSCGYPMRFSFLPSGNFVVVDCQYEYVFIIDKDLLNTLSSAELPSRPYDVTTTRIDEVAVTLKGTIVFVAVSHEVTIKNTIQVDGDCHGIACFGDKLAVTFPSLNRVQILKMNGTIIKTISPTIGGVKVLRNCIYIAISPTKKTMYLSSSEKVFSVSLEGVILATQTMKNNCVCVDDKGTVFVAIGDIVHAFTENELNKIVAVDTNLTEYQNNVVDIACRNNLIYTLRYHDYYHLTEICY